MISMLPWSAMTGSDILGIKKLYQIKLKAEDKREIQQLEIHFFLFSVGSLRTEEESSTVFLDVI